MTLRCTIEWPSCTNALAVSKKPSPKHEQPSAHVRDTPRRTLRRAHFFGAVLIRLRRYDESIEPLRRAAELDPEQPNHWANLGSAYRRLGRNGEAITALQQGLRRHPDDVGLLNNLAVAFRRERRNEEAIPLLEAAIQSQPDQVELHHNLAIALRATERWDEAIPYYTRARELGDSSRGLLFDLAVCYENVGQTALAIETYEAYVRAAESADPAGAQAVRDTLTRLRQR